MSLKLKNIVHTIISEELILEASGPLASFEAIIKAAGKTLIGANDALLSALKRVNPSIKQIYRASDEEIGKAIMKKEFAEYRKLIAKGLYLRFEKDVDLILKKYDLSDAEKQVDAVMEISRKTNVREEIAAEIVKLKVPKKVKPLTPDVPNVPNLPNVSPKKLGAFKSFADGIRLGFYEYLVNNFGKLNKSWKQSYYDNLGAVSVLQKEFNDLAKKVATNTIGVDQKLVNDELQKMAVILAKVGHRKDEQLVLIWNLWKKEMPKEFFEKFNSYQNPEFKKLVKWFEDLSSGKIKGGSSPAATYTKMEGTYSLFTKKESIGKKLQRIFNSVAVLDPRTWAEINASIKIYGFWRSVGKGVGQKLILGFIIFPFYYSILKTLLDYIDLQTGVGLGIGKGENITKGGKVDFVKDNTLGNLGDVFADYGRNFINMYPVIGKDYLKLISWSPLLWFLDRKRYSEVPDDQKVPKLKETKDKIKVEIDKLKKEVRDTVKTDTTLVTDKIKKEWEKLSGEVKQELEKINVGGTKLTPGSYESFVQFCKNQNPPLTPDPNDGSIGIYTAKGVEYEWDGTTFKK